ncbi:hypothetical protein FB451DRAFT_1228179 [Mycena latifolia]|nr:hypothetical protein FB451DRAFT_1228179 [Mycena latifolia]
MPARYKTVRFVDAEDEAPTAPSFPTSAHSPMMPPALAVPTPLRHSRPLYACMELPVVDAELHHTFRIHLESAGLFDVLRDPSYQLPPHLPPTALTEPATYPPSPSMKLICPRLPWRIEIECTAGGFVSVADVRSAIHAALAASVTRAELLATAVLDRPIISMAFEARCERVLRDCGPGAAQVELERGIKRVDFLFGSTIFIGLCATATADVWEMVFSS